MSLTPPCWIITEGHAGMVNQTAGLAAALGLPFAAKVVAPKPPWVWLPPSFWPRPLSMAASGTVFTAPWPEIVISCGRRSVAAAMAVRRMGQNQTSGGKTFAIHIQDPHTAPGNFDALIVPEHDALDGPNVIKARGAVNHLTTEKLDAARAQFAPLFAPLPRPLIAVSVGGATAKAPMTEATTADLADKLLAAARDSGGSLIVTPSRRTGAANEAILRGKLAGVPHYYWDGTGDNPYFGLLANADALVVTSESTNLTCEACFTGKPVHVYPMPGTSGRLLQFHADMERDGYTRPFLGKIGQWSYKPLDETARVAGIIQGWRAGR